MPPTPGPERPRIPILWRNGVDSACAALVTACVPALSILALALTSCQSEPPQVAVLPQTTATSLWEAEHAGAEAAARKLGMKVYWNAPTRGDDVQQQIALVSRSIRRHDRGLILAPDQPLALLVPVRDAIRQGIPTVIVGSTLPLPIDPGLSYIVNDDTLTGEMAAARIGKILRGTGRVAVLGADPASPGSLQILHAFESALERDFSHISLTDRRTGSSNENEAQQVATESLVRDEHLDAIFALTATATRGAYLALRNRNPDPHVNKSHVKLIGFEQDLELLSFVRNGQIDSLIAENTFEMGYRAMELIARSPRPITPGQQLKLPPTLITAENASSPSIQKLLSQDWGQNP